MEVKVQKNEIVFIQVQTGLVSNFNLCGNNVLPLWFTALITKVYQIKTCAGISQANSGKK